MPTKPERPRTERPNERTVCRASCAPLLMVALRFWPRRVRTVARSENEVGWLPQSQPWRLTVKLRGRPEVPDQAPRAHTVFSARGADIQTVHGPLQRLL